MVLEIIKIKQEISIYKHIIDIFFTDTVSTHTRIT